MGNQLAVFQRACLQMETFQIPADLSSSSLKTQKMVLFWTCFGICVHTVLNRHFEFSTQFIRCMTTRTREEPQRRAKEGEVDDEAGHVMLFISTYQHKSTISPKSGLKNDLL